MHREGYLRRQARSDDCDDNGESRRLINGAQAVRLISAAIDGRWVFSLVGANRFVERGYSCLLLGRAGKRML